MGTPYTLIRTDGSYDESATAHGKVLLTKLFAGNELEVLRYEFAEGFFHFRTPLLENGVKSYQLISGQIEILPSREIMNVGDIVLLKYGDDVVYMHTPGAVMLVHAYRADAYNTTLDQFASTYVVMDRIQEKDNYTNEHNNRVYEMTRKIAMRMGFSGNSLRCMLNAARFHDVGKINLPDEILNKPGPLTPEEYATVKGHVLDGRELIRVEGAEEVRAIIVLHHERLDGSGYPYGLKGDDIPTEGRILAVLDSFDAMTTDRIYKKGKTVREAIAELYSMVDVQFDRRILDMLVNVLKEEGRYQ